MKLKSGKQVQGENKVMTEYEEARLMRVQECKEKLRELGIKNISQSLTSLVDQSQGNKKRRVSSTHINDGDPDFTYDMEAEVSKKVIGLSIFLLSYINTTIL